MRVHAGPLSTGQLPAATLPLAVVPADRGGDGGGRADGAYLCDPVVDGEGVGTLFRLVAFNVDSTRLSKKSPDPVALHRQAERVGQVTEDAAGERDPLGRDFCLAPAADHERLSG